MTLLAKRYATALHALATEQGSVDAVEQQLVGLHAALASPEARAVITSPDITAPERAALLEKLTGSSGLLRQLVGVLQQRRRLEVLFDLYPSWRTLAMAARGEVDGVVETAMALEPTELQALTALAGRLTGKKVQLTVAVHPELLGGARLRLGNILYDGSLRAALDQLGQKLAQATV